EESAGATLLRRDGSVWTTDKDGLALGLLAGEMTARTGRDPGELYAALTAELGDPAYARIDAPASPEQKQRLAALSPDAVTAAELAGDRIVSRETVARGNGASLGGLKVSTTEGWFAARPSGTENVYKLYAESFRGADHLERIQEEARVIVERAL
nr:phosphoglucomutase, alpha-D-glucose phosphate-specific [Gemmatimonadaceae bacterium]